MECTIYLYDGGCNILETVQKKHEETIKESDKVHIWSLLHDFIITRNVLLNVDQF